MNNNSALKLIAVINSVRMVLYDAKGIKIISKPEEIVLNSEEHNHRALEKSQSHYQNKSTPGSLFEPHTSLKEIEHNEAARVASKHLDKVINAVAKKYKELIIVAEPQMLGCIRPLLSNHLKKIITGEFSKDLVSHDERAIEKVVFS